MNPEYDVRHDAAIELSEKLTPYTNSVILTGSLAYGPDVVDSYSDLDLLVMADFPSMDFPAVCGALHNKLCKETQGLLKQRKIELFSLDCESYNFPVTVHFWDRKCLDAVVGANGHPIKRFKKGDEAPSKMYSLTGKSVDSYVHSEDVDGGKIWIVRPLFENKKEGELYLGAQTTNLMLYPIILTEDGHEMNRKIVDFRNNISERIHSVYGKGRSASISVVNAIPKRIKDKMTSKRQAQMEALSR